MNTLLHSADFWLLIVFTFGPAFAVVSLTALIERNER